MPARLVRALLEERPTRVSVAPDGCEILGASAGRKVIIALYPDRGPQTLATIRESGPTTSVPGIGDEAVLATVDCEHACTSVKANTLSVLEGDRLVSVNFPGEADRAGALEAARQVAVLALGHVSAP